MHASDQEEVWTMLDRNHLRRLTFQGPRPVFATISGAHLYGFASPDSDVDLRGAFMRPVEQMLSISAPRETITVEDNSTIELDWVAHDLRKFARMMVRHNGYVMEQLYSPLVVVTTPLHETLMDIGQGCLTRRMVRHYFGFLRGRRERLRQPNPTVKHLLYAYRVVLSGLHLMEEGEIESNLGTLNEKYQLSVIQGLIERKRQGAEKMELEEGEADTHQGHLDRLEERLRLAYERSALPDEPQTAAELNHFVVEARLREAS